MIPQSQVASGQYAITRAMIQGRNQIVGKTYEWYQQIDASYYDLYIKVKDTINDNFAPFVGLRTELEAAVATVDLNATEYQTIRNRFDGISRNVQQALDSTYFSGTRYSMGSFGSSMLSDLTYPASNFKSSSSSSLMTIFSHFTMQMIPIPEACITEILSKVVPTLQPYADYYVNFGKTKLASFPTVFNEVSTSTRNVVDKTRSFINKINLCSGLATEADCIEQIVSGTCAMRSLSF